MLERSIVILRQWLALGRDLARQPSRGSVRRAQVDAAEELSLARQLRRLREAVCRTIDASEACASCAQGRPPPHGRWEGGFCCGGDTAELFTEAELAALKLAGTRLRHLRPRLSAAGCIFRGARGCALPPRHRPNICVGYLCNDLRRELARRGTLDRVEAMCDELRDRFEAFARLRRRRLDRRWLDELDAQLPNVQR